MALTDILKEGFRKARFNVFTPKSKEDLSDYLRNDVSDIIKDLPKDKKVEVYKALDDRLDEKFEKYSEHLGSLSSKAGFIAGLGIAYADFDQRFLDPLAFTAAQYTPIHFYMVGAKAALELPHMISYLKDSNDYVGALKWLGMKAVELAIPIFGPIIGSDYTERIVRQRIVHEAKKEVLEEFKLERQAPYKTLDYIAEKLTGNKIEPSPNYSMQHMY